MARDDLRTSAEMTGAWASLLLRLAVAVLFVAAVVPKWMGGIGQTVGFFREQFKDSWLPLPLVTLHGYLTPFVETLIPLWLVVGWKLRWGWVVATLFVISLGFGMAVAREHAVAAHNYLYVLICVAGLYFSQYDRFSVDGWCAAEPGSGPPGRSRDPGAAARG